ncbi:hypothetical protein E4U53_000123, partial [Claviceps sorghi]
ARRDRQSLPTRRPPDSRESAPPATDFPPPGHLQDRTDLARALGLDAHHGLHPLGRRVRLLHGVPGRAPRGLAPRVRVAGVGLCCHAVGGQGGCQVRAWVPLCVPLHQWPAALVVRSGQGVLQAGDSEGGDGALDVEHLGGAVLGFWPL